MNDHGFGEKLKELTENFIKSCRQTGRTTSLIDSLKDGDIVIFYNTPEAKRIQNLCLVERNVKIRAVVINPKLNDSEISYKLNEIKIENKNNRIVFDHSWIEKYYLIAIEQAIANLDYIQKKMLTINNTYLEVTMTFDYSSTQLYCLGTGSMDTCKTCIHDDTWNKLNQLPDTLRLHLQSHMTRVDDNRCRLNNKEYYIPLPQLKAS